MEFFLGLWLVRGGIIGWSRFGSYGGVAGDKMVGGDSEVKKMIQSGVLECVWF